MCLCCQKDQEDQVRWIFIIAEFYCDYPFQQPRCWHAFSSTFNADAVRVYVVDMITMDYAGVASAARTNSTRALFKEIVSRCVAMSSNVVVDGVCLARVLRKKLFSVFAAAIQGGSLSIHINEPRKKKI